MSYFYSFVFVFITRNKQGQSHSRCHRKYVSVEGSTPHRLARPKAVGRARGGHRPSALMTTSSQSIAELYVSFRHKDIQSPPFTAVLFRVGAPRVGLGTPWRA